METPPLPAGWLMEDVRRAAARVEEWRRQERRRRIREMERELRELKQQENEGD